MPQATNGTLLIVDDEDSVRRSLVRLMRKEGYEILASGDAEDAEAILEEHPVDIILCDQDMPGKSGTEFLTGIAQKYPYQRRIMLSGRFRSDDVAAAMDAGAIHKFLMKPWDDLILKADIRESFRQLIELVRQSEKLGQLDDADIASDASTMGLTWGTFSASRAMSRELHTAASRGELKLQFQPQVATRSGLVTGFEALLRWTSRDGPVSPDRFIALAERNGSISKLTQWVINETCFRLGVWRHRWSDVHIGLNVSPLDLQSPKLVDWIEQAASSNNVPLDALTIEVTESRALHADGPTLDVLNAIAELGVTLAIDDFGAGATAITSLARMPFTVLKVDRSLSQQIETKKGATVVSKILEMCGDLGIKSTIEGVETKEQFEFFKRLGATTIQGYFFSPPLTSASVETWLTSGCEGVPSV